jgi:hypothetical protein
MMLAAQFAPIYRVFAGFLTPKTCSHTGTVNHAPLPRESPFGLKFSKYALPQPLPDAPPAPFDESATAGMTRRKIARYRKGFPRHSSLENKNDAGHHLASMSRFPPGILNITTLLILRQQRLNALP